MASWQRWTVAGGIVLAATSCQAEREVATVGVDLAGTAWVAESIAGRGVIDNVQSFIQFDDDRRVSGNTGCNGFTGTYKTDGDRLILGPLATTRRACEDSVIDQERRFLGALLDADRYEVEDELLLLFGTESDVATRLAPKAD